MRALTCPTDPWVTPRAPRMREEIATLRRSSASSCALGEVMEALLNGQTGNVIAPAAVQARGNPAIMGGQEQTSWSRGTRLVNEELNEKLTRVGPGTPGGNLLRRYWHPIAATAELKAEPTKRVRILAEDLVLYQDRSGRLGLVDEPCAHRRAALAYGIPEAHGIRCPYH